MTKIDLSLKINIEIYYYTTIKVTKYYFVGCKLSAAFFFLWGLGTQPPGKAMGEHTQNFTFHTATLYMRLFYAMSADSTKHLTFWFPSIFVLEKDVFRILTRFPAILMFVQYFTLGPCKQ